MLYFFAIGQRIIAVHGIRNKARKISERDLKVALQRKEDWQLRNL
jgi:phage-related protein